jgi:hypothetical protein
MIPHHLTALLLWCMSLSVVGSGFTVVGLKRKCFDSNRELGAAVKNYVAGGKKKKSTLAKYGVSELFAE